MMTYNSQAIGDTIQVINYCQLGTSCPNHNHGIIDTTFYYYANANASQTYFKVMPSEVDSLVDCRNLYKDVFGNIFYMDSEVKQEKKEVVLNSFDTIKVGDKVFPAATPFVPHYYTHTETIKDVHDNYDSVVEIFSFPILVLLTFSYLHRVITNNAWGNLIKDLQCV